VAATLYCNRHATLTADRRTALPALHNSLFMCGFLIRVEYSGNVACGLSA
jgi:hypothetical protein